MRFRPCIDLHDGCVKQIVGGTLTDAADEAPQTNFATRRPPEEFAAMYRRDDLPGGHVIQLGPGNAAAARRALRAYPDGLQLGGGVTPDNAVQWLEAGAQKVIVTSHVFREGRIDWERLAVLRDSVGADRLVLDLSCRRRDDQYLVVTDRWQRWTDFPVCAETLDILAAYCSEFLIHAADVEGKSQGIEEPLVRILGQWRGRPMTYAGGIRNLDDIRRIREAGEGQLDFTVGSALDIFGGTGIRYRDMVELNHTGRLPERSGRTSDR